jgi:hypothetical protein
VAAFVTLSSFLAIGHANSTENTMNRRWDKIDNGDEHLSVVESTQLVDNNMRMVGLLGCACVFLVRASATAVFDPLWAAIPWMVSNAKRVGLKSAVELGKRRLAKPTSVFKLGAGNQTGVKNPVGAE